MADDRETIRDTGNDAAAQRKGGGVLPDGIRGTADDIVPRHIGVDAFADYDFELEVNAANQLDQNGAAPGRDPTGNDPVLEAMGLGKVVRDDPGTAADEGAHTTDSTSPTDGSPT